MSITNIAKAEQDSAPILSSYGALTEPEAAKWLRISYPYLRRLRADNRAPTHVSIGRRVLYRVEDLQAFLQDSRMDAPSSASTA